jgi:PilZ domain
MVADISDGGVRLSAQGADVPEEFILLVDGADGAGHNCRVVWRLGDEVGAEFVDATEDGFALRLFG